MATKPDVVAFGPDLPTADVFELAAALDRQHPEIEILLMADPSPRLWERAARTGIREVVSSSADDEKLRVAVQRTLATITERRGHHRSLSPPEAAALPAVVVVRSPKGGSGKTMVASNIAVLFAKRYPGDVVLVDLDLQFGDVSSALGIEPHYTIADATANIDLTPTSLKASLSKYKSDLYVLCAPPRPDDALVITSEDVTAVLTLLRSAFRFVVVDTAAGSDERTVAALDREVGRSHDRGVGRPAQHVVLNRGDSKVALEVRDIEATVGRPVDVHVASSRLVPLHMNCGVPVVEAEPAAPISKQLRELVERLVPTPAERPSRSRLRRRR